MKKVLFINACVRSNSRTLELAKFYFEKLKQKENVEITEIKVFNLNLLPLTEKTLLERNIDIENADFSKNEYNYARLFASVDLIVIASPYWDSSFPACLKVFIEHICVNTLTFEYDKNAKPTKKCKAEKLIYITTAGGFIPKRPSILAQLKELCFMFGIKKVKFYASTKLDILPQKTKSLLDKIKAKIKKGERL